MSTTHAFRAAIILAAAGAICRFCLQCVETRWQILAFWSVAIGYELLARPMLGHRISVAFNILDVVVVTTAIVATKYFLEGTLFALTADCEATDGRVNLIATIGGVCRRRA